MADLQEAVHGTVGITQRPHRALDEHLQVILAQVPAHIGRDTPGASRFDLLLGLACLPILGREQKGAGLPDRLFRRPAEHRFRTGEPIDDAVLRIGDDEGVVVGRLDREAEALLGLAQVADLKQPVDHRPQDGGVGAQELRVFGAEVTRLLGVSLQEAEGSPSGQEDRHVDQCDDSGFLEEGGKFEPIFLADVRGNDGHTRLDGERLGRTLVHGQAQVADDTGVPADPRSYEEASLLVLEFQNLGAFRSERFADVAAGFGQNVIEIGGPQGQIAEVGERLLSPHHLRAFRHCSSLLQTSFGLGSQRRFERLGSMPHGSVNEEDLRARLASPKMWMESIGADHKARATNVRFSLPPSPKRPVH